MRPLLAGIAAVASAGLLAAVLVAIAGAGREGIADRAVADFGTAPPPAAASPTPSPVTPNVAGDDLAALPEVPAGLPTPAVPIRSGLIGDLAPEVRAAPARIIIGDLAVASPVVDVGYDAGAAEMEVPGSAAAVGWYRFGASPGQEGSAVLAAHVDFNGRAGAFYDLHRLEAGAAVVVVMDDGTRQRWEVVARRQYGKELLPTDAIFARDGEPTLALITCGGPFDGRRYEDNVVVFARLAGSAGDAGGPA